MIDHTSGRGMLTDPKSRLQVKSNSRRRMMEDVRRKKEECALPIMNYAL
jgi:hypothetical protein